MTPGTRESLAVPWPLSPELSQANFSYFNLPSLVLFAMASRGKNIYGFLSTRLGSENKSFKCLLILTATLYYNTYAQPLMWLYEVCPCFSRLKLQIDALCSWRLSCVTKLLPNTKLSKRLNFLRFGGCNNSKFLLYNWIWERKRNQSRRVS